MHNEHCDLIVLKNLKRDLLFKMLYEDWKQKQDNLFNQKTSLLRLKKEDNQFHYKVLLRWKKARGIEIPYELDPD